MGLEDLIRQPEDIVEEQPVEDQKVKKDPFLAPNDIMNGKGLPDVVIDYHYNPFLTNKSLSFQHDCILHAQAMNQNWQLPKQLQYDYLFHSIRKYSRPRRKWPKNENVENIELLQKYYGYNYHKAKDVLRLHTEEQLEVIRYFFREGGYNEKRAKKTT